jgi:hypothetical protein
VAASLPSVESDISHVEEVVLFHLQTIDVSRRACPMCCSLSLQVGGVLDLPGPMAPVVPVACTRCYNVRFFAWRPLAEADVARRAR